MKYLEKFNEAQNKEIILTIDDARQLKNNLKTYKFEKNDKLKATKGYSKPETWDGKEVLIYDLYLVNPNCRYEMGYAILIDGNIEYLIGIYEPHGCSLNAKRGVVTAHGHEEIIKLWLDDGEFERTYTR